MTDIGLVGIENSHTTHFTHLLNVEQRYPDTRVSAVVGDTPERTAELTMLGDIAVVVDEPADLVGRIDAAIVSTRDGAKHLQHTRPLLDAGIPVLVDKPLAASVADAREIISLAEADGTPLLSGSALRYLPQIGSFAPTPGTGALRHLHVVGPADPDDQYSGLFFYGIHLVETALEILGNPVVRADDAVPVSCRRSAGAVLATLDLAGTPVTFTFVVPAPGHKVPFHVTAANEDAVIAEDLELGKDYNAPALTEFVELVRSRAPQRSTDFLLTPVVVLSAIIDALPDAPSD